MGVKVFGLTLGSMNFPKVRV